MVISAFFNDKLSATVSFNSSRDNKVSSVVFSAIISTSVNGSQFQSYLFQLSSLLGLK